MKHRAYWQWKADERFEWEDAHLDAYHTSIFDIPGFCLSLFYCVLATIMPPKRSKEKP